MTHPSITQAVTLWKKTGLLLDDAEHTLDVSGQNCPLPLLKLKVCLKQAQPPELIHLIATDAHSQNDISRFCQLKGHQILDVLVVDQHFHFLVLV